VLLLRKRDSAKPVSTAAAKNAAGWLRANCPMPPASSSRLRCLSAADARSIASAACRA
jgi:hypothetical protein